jgi:hypothetical protein
MSVTQRLTHSRWQHGAEVEGSGEWPTYETLPCLVCQLVQSTIVCLGLVQEHRIYGGKVGGLARPAEWVEEVWGVTQENRLLMRQVDTDLGLLDSSIT